MKKLLLVLFLLFCDLGSLAADTHLLNADLITTKSELENLYFKAAQNKKLSSSDMVKLSQIRANAYSHAKDKNTNIVPVFYKLGNIYKVLKMDNDAVYCYRTLVKQYPYTPLGRKATIELKYYGEAVTDDYGRTTLIPKDEDN